MDMKNCPHCNKELPKEAKFCLSCMGKLVEEVPLQNTPVRKSKRNVLLAGLFVVAVAAVALLVIFSVFIKEQSYPVDKSDTIISAWTMKMRPHGGIDTFNFARENGIVGFGWSLNGNPATVAEYRALRKQEGAYEGDTLLSNTLDDFENITNVDSIYTHLIWVVDPYGYYYICEVVGGYEYSRSAEHDAAGLVNFAECIFYRVGTADLVPTAVIETLSEGELVIHLQGRETTELTRLLWLVARTIQG
ncbi:MAG: zinc ribbon domain-containing protein [Oscillospiraceae bacterium]|nr:zinc ribbon domain-containing protein [Oscillospiraceae bacterium]